MSICLIFYLNEVCGYSWSYCCEFYFTDIKLGTLKLQIMTLAYYSFEFDYFYLLIFLSSLFLFHPYLLLYFLHSYICIYRLAIICFYSEQILLVSPWTFFSTCKLSCKVELFHFYAIWWSKISFFYLGYTPTWPGLCGLLEIVILALKLPNFYHK